MKKAELEMSEGKVYVDEGRGCFNTRMKRNIWFLVIAAVIACSVLAIWKAVANGNKDTCPDIGISSQHCAIMFDGENCDAGSGLLKIKKGGAGKLAKWSPFPSSELERNDVESLIVQAHCQLELWDDDDGLENGDSPDLIIDNSFFSSAKYIDSIQDFPQIRHLDEAISAYRCSCKEPDLTVKFWESKRTARNSWTDRELMTMFYLIDTDKNYKISKEEFQNFLKDVDGSTLYKAADFNDDGTMDFNEFKIMFLLI